jgi:hypothetical protein
MEETLRPNYPFSHDDMMTASFVISGSFIERNKVFVTLFNGWTEEYGVDLRGRILNGMQSYLGEAHKQAQKDASGVVAQLQESALEALSLSKILIERFSPTKDKVLAELGYEEAWIEASVSKDQTALSKLLFAYTRNLPKHLGMLVKIGVDEKRLTAPMDYSLKFIYADDKQEQLKGDVIKNREKVQEFYNAIYTEMMDICMVAQRFYKDDPVTRDKFTFSKVVEQMNATPRKEEEVEDASAELPLGN